MVRNNNLVRPVDARDKAGNLKRYTASGRLIPPAAGSGRIRGSTNKTTKQLREMILGALEAAGGKKGGQEYLRKQAIKQPVAFMTLLGKILPTQITGAGGGPIRIADEAALAKLAPSELEKLTTTLIQIGFSVEKPE